MDTNDKDTNALLAEFTETRERYEKLIKEKGKLLLGAMIKDMLAVHVEITGVVWDQYTPHFNDGEACEFSVHDRRFIFHGKTLDEYDLREKISAGALKQLAALDKRLEALDDAVFVETFGDHAEIRATLDAAGAVVFEVEECEHD